MDTLSPVLAPACIRLDLAAASVRQVLAEAAMLLSVQHGLRADLVLDALWEREQLASTALGQGVALPHARIKGLQAPHAAYLRLAPALPFDAPDDKPVRDVFVLLVPERANERHLQLLAAVAEAFADPVWRETLHQQRQSSQVHHLLCDVVRLVAGS
jgi:PTS system nitrogen regulatory IIA component